MTTASSEPDWGVFDRSDRCIANALTQEEAIASRFEAITFPDRNGEVYHPYDLYVAAIWPDKEAV